MMLRLDARQHRDGLLLTETVGEIDDDSGEERADAENALRQTASSNGKGKGRGDQPWGNYRRGSARGANLLK